jgi:hypothetical protein
LVSSSPASLMYSSNGARSGGSRQLQLWNPQAWCTEQGPEVQEATTLAPTSLICPRICAFSPCFRASRGCKVSSASVALEVLLHGPEVFGGVTEI